MTTHVHATQTEFILTLIRELLRHVGRQVQAQSQFTQTPNNLPKGQNLRHKVGGVIGAQDLMHLYTTLQDLLFYPQVTQL